MEKTATTLSCALKYTTQQGPTVEAAASRGRDLAHSDLGIVKICDDLSFVEAMAPCCLENGNPKEPELELAIRAGPTPGQGNDWARPDLNRAAILLAQASPM